MAAAFPAVIAWISSHKVLISGALTVAAEVPGFISNTKSEISRIELEKVHEKGLNEFRNGNTEKGMALLLKCAQKGYQPSIQFLREGNMLSVNPMYLPRLQAPQMTPPCREETPDMISDGSSESESSDSMDSSDDERHRRHKRGHKKHGKRHSKKKEKHHQQDPPPEMMEVLLDMGYEDAAVFTALHLCKKNVEKAMILLKQKYGPPRRRQLSLPCPSDYVFPSHGSYPRPFPSERRQPVPEPSFDSHRSDRFELGPSYAPRSRPYPTPPYDTRSPDPMFNRSSPREEHRGSFRSSPPDGYESTPPPNRSRLMIGWHESDSRQPAADESKVKKLMSIGFSREESVQALIRTGNDTDLATRQLLQSS